MKPKVAVYTICKNEEQFVDRFMDAVMSELRPDDCVIVCDTGSTDNTVERLRERGATVHVLSISPWRFDVARNAALSLVPEDMDICVAPDLDEFLQPGWRQAIDDAWDNSGRMVTRIRYEYIWNWNEDGSPGVRYFADKIHHRRNYVWRHPCHETLYWVGQPANELYMTQENLSLHHHADPTKSRSNYLHLLKIAVEEEPRNDRMQHYYARELYFNGLQVEASEWFQKHLDNPNAQWRHERSQSMVYLSKLNGNDMWKNMWAYRAVAECPERRDVWWNLYDREMENGNIDLANSFKLRAESLPRDGFYMDSGR